MRFFMISDLHLSNQGPKIADYTFQALYEKIKKNISPDEHLLFIVLGDIIDKGNKEGYVSVEKYFSSLRHELKDYKLKFEFIPGNHDLVNGSLSDFDTFISKMGVDYSFSNNPVVAKEYGNVNFIFADSNLSRDYKASGEINLEAIRLKVIKDKQNILFCHHALTHGSGDEHNCIKNGQEVGDKLKDMGIEFMFHSHTHTCEITHSDNTVFEIGCGSLSQELKDMPLIYNQFSVGGIRDGKIVSIERWVKVNDGVSGFTYESLYPEQKNFADPDTINKKEYSDVLRPHIERLVTQAINDNINNCDAGKPLVNVLGENGRIYIIDDAGAGKTIEMLKLAHDLYRTPYFPAYFSLRDYTGNEIKDLIPEEYCGLNPNRLVIILDGYDEIQEKYRNDFRGKLNAYLLKNCSVRVVLSSRKNFCKVAENGEIRTIDGFVGYKFAQISDADIRKYLIESGIDPQSFYKAVESARVEKMIFTPFYLDGLTKIFLNQNHLPSKNMVMDEIISQRFENDDDKFINISHLNEKKLELFCFLEKLAFAIQLMGTTQITDLEYQDLTPPDWRNLIKMSGLSSQVSGSWLFTHNILREYLAAKCLVKMPFEKILEYCCFENSIKPSWLNTFGFVMGLSKDDRLKEWTVNNASEAIVKYGPDNFEKSRHFEIFIHVFEEYERSYISSFEGLCSENELAEYACCIKGIKYLIEKISSPVNNYSLHNALRIMQHLPRDCGKQTDMRDCLLNFCNGYHGSESYNYRCAIQAICSQNLCDSDLTMQLMNIFGTSDNDFIRAGIYEYLVYTKEQDTYVDYFLGGIRFIKYRLNSHDNRIGNESWALIDGLSAMSTAKSISKVLIRLCDEGNSNFYKSDKVFVTLVSKCSELYKEGHCDLFDVLYECWLKAAMHSRHNEVAAVLDFFRKTDTYSQVVLRFLCSDTPQGFYIGSIVMSYPEIMGTMEQLYKEDKLPDRSVFSKFVENYCRREDYERFSKTILMVEGKTMPEPKPFVDYDKKREDASYEYLSCLFDKSKYRALIDDILTKAGNIDITVDRVSEVFAISDYYNTIIEKTIFAIERYADPYKRVSDFLSCIRWRKFALDEIYLLIKNDTVKLNENQKSAVVKMLLDECANGVSDKAVLEHIHVVIRLLVLCDITLPQTELPLLTSMLWYDFSDKEAGKFAYLESKYTRKSVKEQVVCDVKNGAIDQETLEHDIDYLREIRCEDIVDEARQLCLQNEEHSEVRYSALRYLYDLFENDYIEHELLPFCDKDVLLKIANMDKEISRDELKTAMEKVYRGDKDYDLQAYLITLNSRLALEDYLECVRNINSVPGNYGSFVGGTTEAISCISDIELLPLLEELWAITFNPNFKDSDINGLVNNLYKAYVNCVKVDSDRIEKSIDAILLQSRLEKDKICLHRLKNDIRSETLKLHDTALPIGDVKQIISSI